MYKARAPRLESQEYTHPIGATRAGLPLFTFDENCWQGDEDDLKVHFVVTDVAEDSSEGRGRADE